MPVDDMWERVTRGEGIVEINWRDKYLEGTLPPPVNLNDNYELKGEARV